MTKPKYPAAFLNLLKSVTSKRPRTVIEHILKKGQITTEELQSEYGYEHPPRAARDVREEGIPLETFRVKNKEGRWIAAYRFGDPAKVNRGRLGGRKTFSKKFKKSLMADIGARCSVCQENYEERYLQIDHRIPYEIAGDKGGQDRRVADHMLLCGSCNRAKAWSCEHCPNGKEEKSPEICQTCYWAFPEHYKHVALRLIRRVDIIWSDAEVAVYEKIEVLAEANHISIPQFVKKIIAKRLEELE
jgi:hypothetical protein